MKIYIPKSLFAGAWLVYYSSAVISIADATNWHSSISVALFVSVSMFTVLFIWAWGADITAWENQRKEQKKDGE